jgi:predicted lipoprotein with Yx(FWY)xxD motif
MITNRKPDSRHRGPRTASALLSLVALAAIAAACSGGYGTSAATAPPVSGASGAAAAPATGAALATGPSSLGVILVDGQGRTVYEFANDANGTSACTGQCAANWPPVMAPSSLPASLPGVTGQLGMITRQDGTSQLSVAGHPLYTFAGDTGPGQTNGQGKVLDGGLWTIASAAGAPVMSANPAASSAPAGASY